MLAAFQSLTPACMLQEERAEAAAASEVGGARRSGSSSDGGRGRGAAVAAPRARLVELPQDCILGVLRSLTTVADLCALAQVSE
jgi:hypothetical protein